VCKRSLSAKKEKTGYGGIENVQHVAEGVRMKGMKKEAGHKVEKLKVNSL